MAVAAQPRTSAVRDTLRSFVIGSDRPWDARNRVGLAFLCAALIIGLSIGYENFFTVSNGFTISLNMTAIGLAALGSAFLLICGNVDLSIGGQYALVSVVAAIVARESQSAVAAIVTAIALGAALGFMNGRLVRALALNPLIVTLAMAAILRGLAYVVTDAKSISDFSQSFVDFGRAKVGEAPVPVLIALVVFVVGSLILLKTVVGLRLYAVGGNPLATKLSGVKSDSVVTGAYAANGALIGLVAALTIARLGSAQPSIGINFELDVLTAVILGGVAFAGGMGHPLGVFIGVATIGVLNAGIIFAGIPDFWQQVVRGSVLLLALVGDQVASRRRSHVRPARPVATPVAAPPDAAETGPPGEPEPAARDDGRPARGDTVLACQGLTKSYGSVSAARDVSFSVAAGEIVCLVGDNGAGKSTVIKMISGAVEPDEGWIEVRGERIGLGDPGATRAAGIQTVYQDLALCPNLGSAHNLVLGAEPRRTSWGPLSIRDDRAAEELAKRKLGELGIVLSDYGQPVRLLSGGQRQSVAIGRAASDDVNLVILDEPTAALGVKQTKSVLRLVRSLADRNVGVILISHDLETVYAIADRLVVLRLGGVVYSGPRDGLSKLDLVHLMAGFDPGELQQSA